MSRRRPLTSGKWVVAALHVVFDTSSDELTSILEARGIECPRQSSDTRQARRTTYGPFEVSIREQSHPMTAQTTTRHACNHEPPSAQPQPHPRSRTCHRRSNAPQLNSEQSTVVVFDRPHEGATVHESRVHRARETPRSNGTWAEPTTECDERK